MGAAQLTLMAWPCRADTFMGPDLRFRPGAFEAAKEQHASVANSVVESEPVLMLVRPEHHTTGARRAVRRTHGVASPAPHP